MFRLTLRANMATNMRMIFDAPVCEEHNTPFVEQVLRMASASPLSDLEREIGDHFAARYGAPPNRVLSMVDYLTEDHVDIIEWLAEIDRRKAGQPVHVRNLPIVVQHVSWEEYGHLMSLYPDIRVQP